MKRTVMAMPGNEGFAAALAASLGAAKAGLEWRRFPDGESYVRLSDDVAGAEVIVVCTLADPDPQILSLIYTARTARDLGAARLTLVAPYLAYMRQDAVFNPGEAVSSKYFGELVSRYFDALVTVDPHLHRHKEMSAIYSIPAGVAHAAPLIGAWVSDHVENPLIVGPDEESEQWASEIARHCRAPVTVLRKARSGDRDVRITLPDLSQWRGLQPVLVDDIVSSGRTMIEAAVLLREAQFPAPVCCAVHAIFAQQAYADLLQVAARVVSTDTVAHVSNGMSVVSQVAGLLATGAKS